MIQKSDLTGQTIKKRLNARRCMQRWHNKNKQGGNFGFNIYMGEGFVRERDKEITGYYDRKGNIWSLSFGELYQLGTKIPIWALENLDALFEYINNYMKWKEGKAESPKIRKSELLTKKEQLQEIGFEVA